MRRDEDACDPVAAATHPPAPKAAESKNAATTENSSEPLMLKWGKKHKGAVSREQIVALLASVGEIDMIVVKERAAVVTFSSGSTRATALEWLSSCEANRKVGDVPITVVGMSAAAASSSCPAIVTPLAAVAPGEPQSYEALTMMRMRQAAERQRLAEQIAKEDGECS